MPNRRRRASRRGEFAARDQRRLLGLTLRFNEAIARTSQKMQLQTAALHYVFLTVRMLIEALPFERAN